MNFLTVEQVLKQAEKDPYGLFKYVRVGGEFRFGDVDAMSQHLDLVSAGEKVESAGMVGVRRDYFQFRGYGSDSLKVKWSDEDVAQLILALGKPMRG